MEEEKNTSTEGAAAGSTPSQSAQDDLKKVADRAKAATGGFDFTKIIIGRVDKTNFFYSVLVGVVVGSLLSFIPLVNIVAGLALAVLGIGMSVRRFHDINMTGWATIGLFIPVLGLLGVVYLCWKDGDVATNQYGPTPDPKRDVFKAILNT